jgi:hypothetical protein
MSPADLVTRWREQAAEYERDGQPGARLLSRVAEELEAAMAENAEAVVGLNDGARLCGYSADHLGRLVRGGKIQNHGTRNRPRVRVGDLPRKRLTASAEAGNVRAQ